MGYVFVPFISIFTPLLATFFHDCICRSDTLADAWLQVDYVTLRSTGFDNTRDVVLIFPFLPWLTRAVLTDPVSLPLIYPLPLQFTEVPHHQHTLRTLVIFPWHHAQLDHALS